MLSALFPCPFAGEGVIPGKDTLDAPLPVKK